MQLVKMNEAKTAMDLERDDVLMTVAVSEYGLEEAAENLRRMLGSIAPFVKAVTESFERFAEKVWQLFAELKQATMDECKFEEKKKLYKLDFTRPKICHQVLCRKPRHFIRKIIR